MFQSIFTILSLCTLLTASSSDTMNIVGSYQWECSYYTNNLFNGIHFEESSGTLMAESFEQELLFSLTEKDKVYNFKINRDSVFDYEKAKSVFQNLMVTPLDNPLDNLDKEDVNLHFRKVFNLLSYTFLLLEHYPNREHIRMINMLLVRKLRMAFSKFEKNKEGDKIIFEIDHPSCDIIGTLHLGPNDDRYLECFFESHLDIGCCLAERKGILKVKKIN